MSPPVATYKTNVMQDIPYTFAFSFMQFSRQRILKSFCILRDEYWVSKQRTGKTIVSLYYIVHAVHAALASILPTLTFSFGMFYDVISSKNNFIGIYNILPCMLIFRAQYGAELVKLGRIVAL